jgi:CubicO group peptidase (beta-lactamase class C family)/acetyl esterase/lipase
MHYILRTSLVLGFVFAVVDILPAQGTEDAPAIIILKDIPYYLGKDADPERNRLDLYLPKGQKDFPVLFWVHGGALRKGDRQDTQPLGEFFARQGIGFVTTGYRLSPAVKHPAHIEDVARAFAWTVGNITKHGGRTDAIFVAGHSAGASLAALLATDESYLKAHKLAFSNIKGVISVSGQQRHEFSKEWTDTFGTSPEAFTNASPLNHVGIRHPPFLILFAEKDFDSMRKTSAELGELLKKRKIETTVVDVKNRDHGSIIREIPKADDSAARAMLEFISKHSKPGWADEFDNVRDRIRQYIDKEGVPSISIAVVKGDAIVWEEGFGWADVEKRVRATPHTAYMLASVSKPITATIMMLLAERKLVDLDCPVNEYLGENKIRARLGDASRVTVREILQHTSGLPNYYETFYADERDTPRSVDLLLRQYGWTMIPQGRFHYSNLGYTLLGEIAARVTGKAFAALAKQELFAPLGMEQAFVPTDVQRPKGAAIRYATNGARLPECITALIPAADIHASAHDLALFALLHLKAGRKPLLPDKVLDAMWKHPVRILNFKYDYGLGWSVGVDAKGRRHIFHGGGSAGCDAHLCLLPEKNLAVVILVNRTRKWPGTAVTQDLLDLTLAGLLGEEVKDVHLEFGADRPSRSRFASEVQGVWRGTVATPKQALPVALTFKESGEVTAILGKQAEAPVKEVKYLERIFLGRMQGDIGVEDATRRSYHLDWDLTIVDNKLCGVLYAIGSENSRGLLLPYWAELQRRKE